MKKTIFLFAFLFVSLFASANEVESKALVVNQAIGLNTKEFSISVEDDSSYFFLTYCVTRTNNFYIDPFTGMDGQVYERWEVVTTTTCYTV